MKLLLAGDSHGDANYMQRVLNRACHEDGIEAVIQMGDFGYGWAFSQRKGTGEKYDTFTAHVSKFAALADLPVYWLPGNHENYDALEELVARLEPQPNGTYEIEPNVFYIPRGTVLEFGGLKFLCCGGACSVDQAYRILGQSYWTQELITSADIDRCIDAGPVDVVLTHDFPWECTVIDRHLSPSWGEKAQRETIQGRMNVSAILNASGASNLFHGHLHLRYNEKIITASEKHVWVTGLACNFDDFGDAIFVLDTEGPRFTNAAFEFDPLPPCDRCGEMKGPTHVCQDLVYAFI